MAAAQAPTTETTRNWRAAWSGWTHRHPALTELLVLLSIYGLYSLIRNTVTGDEVQAVHTADALLRFEAIFGLDFEASTNAGVAGIPWLSTLSSAWYSSLHYYVTLAVLITLFRKFPDRYRALRRGLLSATLTALVFFVLMPTAPPRLMPNPPATYIDTVMNTMPFHSATASAPATGFAALTNQYAAFPSMHAGWALWVAIAIFVMTRSVWWRAAGVAYALITAAAVVVTANHWVIDVLAGWFIIVVAYILQRQWQSWAERRKAARVAAVT